MIIELLQGKTAIEKATIKGREIAKLSHAGKFTKEDVEIEILQLSQITGGVSVLARAWKLGKPIGFGKDGSVEIEKFNIYNPPIFVNDTNGDYIIEVEDKVHNTIEQVRYREDLIESIREVIFHNVRLVGKEDAQIVKGKIGRTTSTFYPNPNPESTSMDGQCNYDNSANTWATVRGASASATASDSGTSIPCYVGGFDSGGDRFWLYRAFLLFDTSSLPDTDDIDSATLSIWPTAKSETWSGTNKSLRLITTTPASNTALVTGDYDQVGSVAQATDLLTSAFTTGQYNDFTLNATGLGNIAKTGITKFGLRHTADTENEEPPTTGSDVYNGLTSILSADAGGGTANAPKLVVVHSPPTTDYTLPVVVGAFTLTGIASLFHIALRMLAVAGSFVLTGINNALIRGRGILAEVGSFSLTGIAVLFRIAVRIAAAVGQFTLTGVNTAFSFGRNIVAAVGSFVLTGFDIRTTRFWSNQTRSSSTFSNQSKNDSEWENQSESDI